MSTNKENYDGPWSMLRSLEGIPDNVGWEYYCRHCNAHIPCECETLLTNHTQQHQREALHNFTT